MSNSMNSPDTNAQIVAITNSEEWLKWHFIKSILDGRMYMEKNNILPVLGLAISKVREKYQQKRWRVDKYPLCNQPDPAFGD